MFPNKVCNVKEKHIPISAGKQTAAIYALELQSDHAHALTTAEN